jgi:tetratricopeptide (TPR) repeat protein
VLRLDSLSREETFHSFETRGHAYAKLTYYDKAIDDYTKALRINDTGSDGARVYYNRAYSYWMKGNYYRALEDYTESLNLNNMGDEGARTYNSRGDVYRELKKYDKAIDDYSKALRLDPVEYAKLKDTIEELKRNKK